MGAPDATDPRTLRRGYLGGLALAAVPALAGQLALGSLIPGGTAPLEGVVLDIGYSFTGLSLLAVVHTFLRMRRWRRGAGRPFPRELLGAALVLQVCTLAGLGYWALAGAQVHRHARTFLAIAPVAFLVLVPWPGRYAGGTPRGPA